MILNLWYALLDLEIGVIEVVLIWLDATSLVDIFHVVTWYEGGLLVDILLLVVGDLSWILVVGDESRVRGSDAVPFISGPSAIWEMRYRSKALKILIFTFVYQDWIEFWTENI